MRAKPDMKPWVSTDKSKMSSFRSGTNNASIGALALGLCRPYGAQKKYVSMPTQGLRPGLFRSIALTGLIYVFTTNQLLGCFDALVLLEHSNPIKTKRAEPQKGSTLSDQKPTILRGFTMT